MLRLDDFFHQHGDIAKNSTIYINQSQDYPPLELSCFWRPCHCTTFKEQWQNPEALHDLMKLPNQSKDQCFVGKL